VGDFLSAQLPPDTLLAIHSAGAIPYFAGFPTIDMWGLTDHHIARTESQGAEAGHEKSDPHYVFGDNWFGRPPDLYLPEERVFTLKPWSLEPPPNFPDGFVDAYKSVSIAVEGRWLNIWTRKGFLSEAARRGGGQGG